MVLSCSAVRVVCQISNGVLIMILHQVHFIGGLKSSDNRPAMRYWNTSSLEYIPVTLKVVEYVSLHYGCPKCKTDEEKTNIIHAPVPPALLRSYASPSIVAWVIYSKYVNGMPLYRQEKDWLQYGFELSRATMANWVIECTDKYLRVLYEFYHRLLLSREFAMANESPIQVLKEEGREATAKSYMWLFRSGEDDTPPIVLYKYAPTRRGDVAKEFLKGFNGYLMADGYTGYNKVQDIKRFTVNLPQQLHMH